MNSNLIAEVFGLIRETTKTSNKKKILKDFIDNANLQRVLVAGLTPTTSYGIANLPVVIKHGSKVFDDTTWEIIDSLSKRTLTGDAARVAILGERVQLTEESSNLLFQILTKDFQAGFGIKLVNTVSPGLINTVPYMRCSLWKDNTVNWAGGIYVQTKCDGLYGDGTLEWGLRSRTGHSLYIPQVVEEIELLLEEGERLNGELLFYHATSGLLPREVGNGVANSNAPVPDDITPMYVVWDLSHSNKPISYQERFEELQDRLSLLSLNHIHLVKSSVAFTMSSARTIFDCETSVGGEGVILKDPLGLWLDGTSTKQWKMKKEFTCELRVKEFIEGTGKNTDTFGSLLCETDDRMLSVAVSGFSDRLRQEIWDNERDYLGAIIEVKFKDVMHTDKKGYSLFEPRFVAFRTDKTVTDTTTYIVEGAK
jgi:hypothetical protein